MPSTWISCRAAWVGLCLVELGFLATCCRAEATPRRLPRADESNVAPDGARSGWPFSLIPPAWPYAPARPPAARRDRLANYPDRSDVPLVPSEAAQDAPRGLVPRKAGFFQKLSLTASWIPRQTDDDLGVTNAELYASFGLPFPSFESPLIVTPGFNFHLLSGPEDPELPARVYDAYLHLMWLPMLNDRWSGILAVSPGIYSDFKDVDDQALRITGRALARYEWVPNRLEVLFGIVYLDRTDLSLLPAAGLVWTPTDDVRLDLIFPRPKLAWRFAYDNATFEDWLYLLGEFGGDTWSVERESGRNERITSRDWKAIIGYERKLNGGAGYRAEIAYVFSREVEFESGGEPDYEPDDTLMLRASVAY